MIVDVEIGVGVAVGAAAGVCVEATSPPTQIPLTTQLDNARFEPQISCLTASAMPQASNTKMRMRPKIGLKR